MPALCSSTHHWRLGPGVKSFLARRRCGLTYPTTLTTMPVGMLLGT